MYFEDFIIDLAVINHIFFRITTKLAKRLCEEGMNLNIVIKGRKLIIFFKYLKFGFNIFVYHYWNDKGYTEGDRQYVL